MTLDLTDFQDLAKPVTFEIIFHALQQQTTAIYIRFPTIMLYLNTIILLSNDYFWLIASSYISITSKEVKSKR